MTNADPDWASDNFTIASLGAGMSTTVDIDLLISPTFMGDSLVNNVEITSATNALGLEDEDNPLGVTQGMVDSRDELDTDDDINDEAPGTPGTADNAADVDDLDPAYVPCLLYTSPSPRDS